MHRIDFIEEKSFFHVEIINNVNHLDIIDFLKVICSTKIENNRIMLITDYLKAMINEDSIEPIEKIALFFNSTMINKFEHIKWANVSLEPLPTTGAIILYELIKNSKLEYQTFSTLEKALNWMKLSIGDLNRAKTIEKKR
jgi:hypothetical protein